MSWNTDVVSDPDAEALVGRTPLSSQCDVCVVTQTGLSKTDELTMCARCSYLWATYRQSELEERYWAGHPEVAALLKGTAYART